MVPDSVLPLQLVLACKTVCWCLMRTIQSVLQVLQCLQIAPMHLRSYSTHGTPMHDVACSQLQPQRALQVNAGEW